MKLVTKDKIYARLEEIVSLGDDWHREHIPGPNPGVLRDAMRVFLYLMDVCNLYPSRIAPTVGEGLYIEYPHAVLRVILEIYNEGGAAILLTNYKEIVDSVDIGNTNLRVDEICDSMKKILGS